MRKLRFRPLLPVTELDSPFNRGWRFWVVVSGAVVLLALVLTHVFIAFKLIGLL